MKKNLTLATIVFVSVALISLVAVSKATKDFSQKSNQLNSIANSHISSDQEVHFYRRGCLSELISMEHFLKESISYQQGIFPEFTSQFSAQQISTMIGRPLTDAESDAIDEFSDVGMTMAVNPEFVGQSVSSAGPEDRIIITTSGHAPDGLSGYVTGSFETDFEISSP